MKDLEAIHDSRKSFYNKAKVMEHYNEDNELVTSLYSYDTLVCYIVKGKAIIIDAYSHTTTRHVKEFLKQNGFKVESTEQILNDYVN